MKTSLPDTFAATVKTAISDWQSSGKMQRLWQRDASLWTDTNEANRLGWLDIVEDQIAHPVELRNLAKEVWSTFGVVKAAQARSDFQALAERGRRALRIRVGSDVDGGLAKLTAAVQQAIT